MRTEDAHPVTHAARSDHRFRRPGIRLAAAVGGAAAVLGAVVGTATLLRGADTPPDTRPTAQHITVSPPQQTIPLTNDEIVALLGEQADFGALAETQRRSSCLTGLDYPATAVLGARVVDVGGQPAVLLLLPADTPDTLVALLVRPYCSLADTGLIADTRIPLP